jgi:hypothetical protein
MDFKQIFAEVLTEVVADHSAANATADEAAADQAVREAMMQDRCEMVGRIMEPLLEQDGFVKKVRKQSIEKLRTAMQKARDDLYECRESPYSPSRLSETFMKNYLTQNSRPGEKWKPLWETYGSFVFCRHTKEFDNDSEVRIILGLVNIDRGKRHQGNFNSLQECTEPLLEIDIVVKAAEQPLFQICYSMDERHEMQAAQRNQGNITFRPPSMSEPMTIVELARHIYKQIFKAVKFDLTGFEAPGQSGAASALPSKNKVLEVQS